MRRIDLPQEIQRPPIPRLAQAGNAFPALTIESDDFITVDHAQYVTHVMKLVCR